jgi:DNA-binding MarR family transcriptional regulator
MTQAEGRSMNKTDEKAVREALTMYAKLWLMGRVLREHTRSSTAPTDEHNLSDRENLTLGLIENFPGQVTAKTLVRVFDLHFSSAGAMIGRLSKLGILKETKRGQSLVLTDKGRQVMRRQTLLMMARIQVMCSDLDLDEYRVLARILTKMYKATTREVEERIFNKPPIDLHFPEN